MGNDYNNLPSELMGHHQWVCWKYAPNPNNSQKPKKAPINPKNGKKASVKDPDTWATFGTALKRYQKGSVDGIGFVFTENDPYVAIDLDDCRNKKSGKLKPWAKKILNKIASYTELSPSGSGLHIIAKGKLPGRGRRVGKIEMYDTARFFTMTGEQIDGRSSIKNCTRKIDALYTSTFSATDPVSSSVIPATTRDQTDLDLLAKLFMRDTKGKFSKLWFGDYSNYPSQSEADLAFCSIVSGVTDSPVAIDNIFRNSKLMRPKWDEKHGEQTYGAMTIAKVLANRNSAYSESDEDRSQYEVALKVVEQIGAENIFSHATLLWLWKQEIGVWKNPPDDEVKKFIIQFEQRKNVSTGSLNSVLGIIKILVYSEDTRFSKNAHRIINCANGELHFEDGHWILRPHNRDNNFCHQIPVTYDPTASCPRFDQFLDEVFEPDEDRAKRIRLLQEFFGYALTTSCEYERFLLLLGSGSNGKSVILVLLKALLGLKNIAGVQPNQFENKYQLAHLHGKLANIITELPEGAVIADAKIKALVSGEMMTAEHKYGHPFDFEPYSTMIFSTNHLPHTKDCSHAFFRRAEIITFNRTFEGDDCDSSLKEELPKTELQGVLNFALKGLKRLYRTGNFTSVPSSHSAKQEWELAADQVKAFINDQCKLSPTAKTPIGRLYDRYKVWAAECGVKSAVSKHTLTSRLKRMGCMHKRGSGGVHFLVGIELKPV